MIMIHGTQLID